MILSHFQICQLVQPILINQVRPYTYDVSGQGLRFNLRTPDEHDLKLRIDKNI